MTATRRILESKQRALRHRAHLPQGLPTRDTEFRKGTRMRQRLQFVVTQHGTDGNIRHRLERRLRTRSDDTVGRFFAEAGDVAETESERQAVR
jgi:hypothetical protein